MPETEPDPGQEIVVDGEVVDFEQRSWGEQLEVRKVARGIAGGPDASVGELAMAEFVPALVVVVKRRTEPEYSLEQALALKPSDVLREPSSAKPTRRKAAAK